MGSLAAPRLTDTERAETVDALRTLRLSLSAPADYGRGSRLAALITEAEAIERSLISGEG